MILPNVYGSLIVLCRSIISDLSSVGITPALYDFEAHADTHELPNSDLFGPAAVAIEETTPDQFVVTFALGISAYNDTNLFRHREMAARALDRLAVRKTIDYYDAVTAQKVGYMVIADGTTLPPMTRAGVRPLQFVQVEALLEPQRAGAPAQD